MAAPQSAHVRSLVGFFSGKKRLAMNRLRRHHFHRSGSMPDCSSRRIAARASTGCANFARQQVDIGVYRSLVGLSSNVTQWHLQ